MHHRFLPLRIVRVLLSLLAVAVVPATLLAQGKSGKGGGQTTCPAGQVCTASLPPPGGDTSPPVVTFTPLGGNVYSAVTTVTIGWCDDTNLSSTTRQVKLNGVARTSTYTTGSKTGCGAYATSAVTDTLVPGNNTQYAYICDGSGNCTQNSVIFNYVPADASPPVITITPGAQTTSSAKQWPTITWCDERKLGADSSRTLTFNGADVKARFTYGTQTGTTGCASKAVSALPDTDLTGLQLQPGANTLTAAVRDSAGNRTVQTVTWTYQPVIDLSPTNQASVTRRLGDAALTYSTPSYRSLDADRGVTLVYTSFAARPTVMLSADVTDNSTQPALKSSIGMSWRGVMQSLADGRTALSYTTGAGTSRLTAVYGAGNTPTRSMDMVAVVTRTFADAHTEQLTAPVRILVVNQQNSDFGAGWTVAGVGHVYNSAANGGDGGVIVTHGDGTASYYPQYTACNASKVCAYGHAPGDFGTMAYDSLHATYTYTAQDGTVSTFDGTGNVTRVQDRAGNAVVYGYTSGKLASITDPAGLVTTLAYDGAGKISTITDPAGRVSRFQVNASGDLVSITDPDGTVALTATYLSTHRVSSYTDRGGRQSDVTYDAFGRVATIQGPQFTAEGGQAFRLTSSVTSPEKAAEADPAGGTDAAPFARVDPATLRTSTTDAEGRVTRYVLDGAGRPTRVEDPRGYVTTVTYNPEGEDSLLVDAKGNRTSWMWSNGTMTQANTPSGPINLTYDSYGNVLTVAGNTPAVRNWWNATTGVLDSTSVAGDTTRYTYDSLGRVLTSRDPEGHLTTVVYADTSRFRNTQSVSSGGRTTSYQYDAYGRPSALTNANGRVTRYAYDLVNRDTSVTTPDLGVTHYAYGPLFLNSVTDARSQVYSWTRNALGMPEREVRPGDLSGQNLTYAYDRYGRVTTATNRRGQPVSFTYDGWDRVLTRTADGQTTTFSYSPDSSDPNAPWWVAVSNSESTDTVHYDGKGRVTSVTNIRAFGGIGQTQTYQLVPRYDSQDRQVGLAVVEPGGVRDSLFVTYDPTTYQLQALNDLAHGNTTFAYNRDGLPAITTLPNAVQISQSYTTTHALNQISYSAGLLDSAAGVSFEYDALDRVRTRIADSYGTKRTYTYDPNGNFLSSYGDYQENSSTHPTCSWDANNGYVCTDPITNWTSTGGDTFAYDLTGNPTDHGAVTGSANRLTQFNGYTLGYDADGNLTSKTKSGFTQTFTWNSLGQLASVTTNGQTVSYGYDGMGGRVRKRVGITDFGYLYDGGGNLLLEYDASGVQAKYTYYPGSDVPHSVVRGSTPYYFATDPQGSVLALFTGTNQLVDQYTYLPFGEAQSTSETMPNRIRYAGRELESESGLYYNNARWYDPSLHRFISEDPIGIDGGINLYAYTMNDPVNYLDPSGMDMAPTKCVEEMRAAHPDWNEQQAADRCRELIAGITAYGRRRLPPAVPDASNFGRDGSRHAPPPAPQEPRDPGAPGVAHGGASSGTGAAQHPDWASCGLDAAGFVVSAGSDLALLSGVGAAADGYRLWQAGRAGMALVEEGAVVAGRGALKRESSHLIELGTAKAVYGVSDVTNQYGAGLDNNSAVRNPNESTSLWRFVPFVGTGFSMMDMARSCAAAARAQWGG